MEPRKLRFCRSCQSRTLASKSSASRNSSLTSFESNLSCCRWPPRQELRAALVLPASVTGPVDRLHGCQVLIS